MHRSDSSDICDLRGRPAVVIWDGNLDLDDPDDLSDPDYSTDDRTWMTWAALTSPLGLSAGDVNACSCIRTVLWRYAVQLYPMNRTHASWDMEATLYSV